MEMQRCSWAGDDPLYIAYHDSEWGVPVHNDRRHFELLSLEGAQAGLSWITVLRKREAYRLAFDRFDPGQVADFGEAKISALLDNPGVVRNRLKINSAINNARAFLEVQRGYGSFDEFIWAFVDGRPLQNYYPDIVSVPATTSLSTMISKDLKRRGFSFVGPTIVYAYMQAAGLVNDHVVSCYRHGQLA